MVSYIRSTSNWQAASSFSNSCSLHINAYQTSPGSSGTIVEDEVLLSLEENGSNMLQSLKLYPYPMVDNINIELPYAGRIEIYNVMGQLVFSEKVIDRQIQLEFEKTAGVYLLKFYGEGLVLKERFVLD